MSLNICCDIQMVGPELVLNNIRWGIFSKHTAYLSIVVPHFYPYNESASIFLWLLQTRHKA